MSEHTGKELPDGRLKYLIETADECHVVPGGYRLRFTRSNTTLLLVVGAIDANPALCFTMTTSETGACWVDMWTPDTLSVPRPAKGAAPKPARVLVVA